MSLELVYDFSECDNVSHLATLLGVQIETLEQLANPSALQERFILHKIPKRSSSGGFRVVLEPNTDELKFLFKSICVRLGKYSEQTVPNFPSIHSFGFIKHRSIKQNAAVHVGASTLLRADIKDFFQAISVGRVTTILRDLRLAPMLVDLLSRILCPQGFVSPGLSTSPLISNLACLKLDQRLAKLANNSGCAYSRYADDLAFSGNQLPTTEEVGKALEAEGFQISLQKCRLTKLGQAHFVTGLSISDPAQPHVPKKMKRALRQELYYAEKFGVESHLQRRQQTLRRGLNRLDGTVQYVSHIEGGALDCRSRWNDLLRKSNLQPTYSPRWEKILGRRSIAIDESQFKVGSRSFLGLCAIVYEHEDAIVSPLVELQRSYVADPFGPGRKQDLRKKGLHFSTMHPEIQAQAVKVVAELPFRAYIAFKEASENYSSDYIAMLDAVLITTFGRCDRKVLSIYTEQNSSISRKSVSSCINNRLKAFEIAESKRPIRIESESVVGKEFVPCWVADIVLGVFGRFTSHLTDERPISVSQFERLRHRVAIVLDFSRQCAYSKRRPYQPIDP